MSVHVVGVRHHSPACARLVARTVEAVRPRFVLIEGPADMNDRLDELALGHRLPVAIFSFCAHGGATRASWSPFCDSSPEWVALEAARRVGAEARFMDLPAWHEAFHDVRNRYADHHGPRPGARDALAARLGIDDPDALWDHLFEQPCDDLAGRLEAYFEQVRRDEPVGERDRAREAFMARCVGWAAAQGGDVVVVCGGFHAPFLERAWREAPPGWPETPAPPDGARVGSYLVPYTFHRLDSFVGYEAGMPSPAFYQAVWDLGPERAAEALLGEAAARLRRRRQPLSAADLIAAWAHAQGLRDLRGHTVVTRADVLDGIAAAWVKDALEAPLPWSRRGPLAPRTDPLLVEVVAAFSGERAGALAPGTPRPPLLADVEAELAAHDLTPARAPRRVTLSLVERLPASRVLHRLRVLRVPGFVREAGPRGPEDGALEETWTLARRLEAEAALIEAAGYGATLAAAATARLEEALLAAGGRLSPLAALLGEAAFTGIEALGARVLEQVGRAVGGEPSLVALGDALAALLGLWRHGALLGAAGAAPLARVLEAAFERGLWLVERVQGTTTAADAGEVRAVAALRDALRQGRGLSLDRARALAVHGRCAHDPGAPPALRGAALGFLWAAGGFDDPAAAEAEAVRAVRAAALPARLGDFLLGLFCLAREEVLEARGLLAAVDEALVGLDRRGFLVALPALRLAFGYFPPVEKERLARGVLALSGADPGGARSLLRLEVDADVAARGLALEEQVTARARRFGLDG